MTNENVAAVRTFPRPRRDLFALTARGSIEQ